MPSIPIPSITVDSTVQIRRAQREQTVRRYVEAFEKLPPVVVFKTPEGLLLADGFHRLAAANRLGKAEIHAEIRQGTYTDALEFAVVSNTKNAEPLRADERDEGIRRLKHLHARWSLRQIADAMSISHVTVKRVLDADRVRHVMQPPVTMVTASHLREVARLPKQCWRQLLEAIRVERWSVEKTAQIVGQIKDKSGSPEECATALQDKIGSGKAGGERIRTATHLPYPPINMRVGGVVDGGLAIRRALNCVALARKSEMSSILRSIGPEGHAMLVRELSDSIQFLQLLLDRTQLALRRTPDRIGVEVRPTVFAQR